MDLYPGLVSGPVYLDYNATTPVDPRVADLIQPYLTAHFGNPSSTHVYAAEPAAALHTARRQVAALIGADPDGIVFTGSGSEANNLAIRSTVLASNRDQPHVISQQTEHPAVLATCSALQRLHGVRVTLLPVDGHGLVDPQDLAAAITPHTVLVSIMLANNETGTIQPVAELARIAHEHGVPLHTDAAQAVGKIPVDVGLLGTDLLTVVGETVALSLALGAAADLAGADLAADGPSRLVDLRDRPQQTLTDALPDAVWLNGHPDRRLPNTPSTSASPAYPAMRCSPRHPG